MWCFQVFRKIGPVAFSRKNLHRSRKSGPVVFSNYQKIWVTSIITGPDNLNQLYCHVPRKSTVPENLDLLHFHVPRKYAFTMIHVSTKYLGAGSVKFTMVQKIWLCAFWACVASRRPCRRRCRHEANGNIIFLLSPQSIYIARSTIT